MFTADRHRRGRSIRKLPSESGCKLRRILGSEVAHRVSLTLATVRRSNRACRSPAHGFHEDAFEVPKEEAIQPGQPAGPAVVQPDRSMNGPSWEPVRWIQSTSLLERERTGFSLKELFRPPSSLLIWFPFSARPSSPAAFPDPIPSPVARSRGFHRAS